MIPIGLIEFMHNLKDHDYDVNGTYKVDEQEANKLILAISLLNVKLTKLEKAFKNLERGCDE